MLIFEKYSNAEFHENPSSGSGIAPCGRTDGWTDEQTDKTKPIVASPNFAGGPNNARHVRRSCISTDVFDFDTEICIDVSVSEESVL